MRVFRLTDGTSWVARVHEPASDSTGESRSGWDAILFEQDTASVAQRLVYRPAGWLDGATLADLTAALEEGVVIRTRWGG